ncbi:MAG TPA: GNAT family N-acetyltransferase [Methanomassiliicoccales archaeon]|jgi:GNAT superfamily N-acetyltransferase
MQTETIRTFRNDDLDELHRMIMATIEECYSEAYPPEAVSFFQEYHSPEHISDDASNGYTIVVVEKGSIVGTGTLLGSNIRRVFVLPSRQGKGIGSMIMAELERKAAGNSIMAVELDSSSVSVDFYDHLGYVGASRHNINLKGGARLEHVPMRKRVGLHRS